MSTQYEQSTETATCQQAGPIAPAASRTAERHPAQKAPVAPQQGSAVPFTDWASI